MSAGEAKLPPNPFTQDEAGLQELLLEQAGTIGELARENDEYAMRTLRYDEGVACLQWMFAKAERCGFGPTPSPVFVRCLGELVAFSETGREPGWLKAARSEMGR